MNRCEEGEGREEMCKEIDADGLVGRRGERDGQ
jgi:hypothetical protein